MSSFGTIVQRKKPEMIPVVSAIREKRGVTFVVTVRETAQVELGMHGDRKYLSPRNLVTLAMKTKHFGVHVPPATPTHSVVGLSMENEIPAKTVSHEVKNGGHKIMHSKANVSAILVANFLVLAFAARAAHGDSTYIYDAKGKTDKRSIVIHRETGHVDIVDKEDATLEAPIGLTDRYRNCGNAEFFCIEDAIDVVVPKVMPRDSWSYRDWSCRKTGEIDGDIIYAACEHVRLGIKTAITYSFSRGVLSFTGSRAGDAMSTYQLRGEFGMFSRGNNP